ncbi:MAG: HNH endonuclease family protein, partial [Hyphomonadaceae bacterium]
ALTLQRLDPRRRSAVIARAVDRFAEFGRFGAQGGFVFNRLAHEKMRRGLEGPALDGPTRNVMLRWIEAARHGDRVPYYVCRASGATVEHVYPKNPQDKWPQFDGTFEESVTLQEQMGNLCILPEDRLDNADFETKRRAYARARGYLFANEIAKHREWNPNVLRGRTIELADQTMRFLNFEIAQS